MNLIEQLVGYEIKIPDYECYQYHREQLGTYEATKHLSVFGMTEFGATLMRSALLQYRRQHNTYEVGDKVVIRRTDGHPEIFTYESVSASGNMHFFESPFNYGHLDLCKVRHATDAEIKAGRRL